MSARAAFLVAAVAAACGGSAPAASAIPHATGTIVFSYEGELLMIAPDGSGLESLGEKDAYVPRFSPDGRSIAYLFGLDRIWIVRSTGEDARALTRPTGAAKDVAFAWSPRGDRLVFRRVTPRRSALRTIGIDGRSPLRLPSQAVALESLDWSPDGRHLVGADRRGRLWIVDADGSRPRRVGPPSVIGRGPRWSPDGRSVSLVNRGAGLVRVLELRSGRVRTVFDVDAPLGEQLGLAQAWSPDGRSLAVIRAVDDECIDDPTADTCLHTELWIVGSSGSRRDLVYTGPSHSSSDGLDWGRVP